MTQESTTPPTFQFFQRQRSPSLLTNFGWLHKPLTHPYQHKYRNIFISWFYYHSTHVKIPKINSFLPIWLLNILLLNFTHIFIFTNTIIWTFCFLFFVNTVDKFFTCLLVVWFATLCFFSFPCSYMLDITRINNNIQKSITPSNYFWKSVCKYVNL